MTLTIHNKIDAKSVKGYGDPLDPLNQADIELLNYPPAECPLIHRFTPGMYIREIHMAKGTLLTTLLHLTTHPFFVLKGDVSVWYHDMPVQRYVAPYTGITQAGTRRMLFAHEDTVWTTCHVTDLTDPDEIAESITSQDFNPLIDKSNPRFNMWRHNRMKLEDAQ
jgi:hypothetical protein